MENKKSHYILQFLVPEEQVEKVKNAIFAIGAGSIGNYSHCAWQTLGEGQFKPLAGSQAYIGEINQLERVAEYKVEIICNEEQVKPAVLALKEAHPYEEPAYQVLRCENIGLLWP